LKKVEVANELKIGRLEPRKQVYGIHIFVYQYFKLFWLPPRPVGCKIFKRQNKGGASVGIFDFQ
jgi:hypothetical protein